MVARAEAPVALSEPARLRTNGPEAGRLLRRPTQHASAPLRIPGADARRNVFGHWIAHSKPTEGRTIGGPTITT